MYNMNLTKIMLVIRSRPSLKKMPFYVLLANIWSLLVGIYHDDNNDKPLESTESTPTLLFNEVCLLCCKKWLRRASTLIFITLASGNHLAILSNWWIYWPLLHIAQSVSKLLTYFVKQNLHYKVLTSCACTSRKNSNIRLFQYILGKLFWVSSTIRWFHQHMDYQFTSD